MNKKYRVLYLCADLLDFDGTRGDMLYFLSRLRAYNIEFDYVEHQLGEAVDLRDFDFVYAGVCPQKYESLYLRHLVHEIKGIREYIESGKVILAVEQSFLFLTKEVAKPDGTSTNLLNILPFSIQEQESYTIGNVLLDTQFNDFSSKINGFINTRYYFNLQAEETAEIQTFGEVLLGTGYLWERKFEGIRYKNFFGTQLRGPLLPRNYDLCDYLIKTMTNVAVLPTISSELELQAKNKLTADCVAFIESEEQKKEYVYVS